MSQLKAILGWKGALSFVALMSVAAWAHINYMYVGQAAGLPLNGFIQRATVAEQLRGQLSQREDAAIEDLRARLSELRGKVLGRFDADFTPSHQSTVQSAIRDANYWLKFALTLDREKALKDYYDEIKDRLKNTVISPTNLTKMFEAILVDVSEKYLGSSVGVENIKNNFGVFAVAEPDSKNSNFARAELGAASAGTVRSWTFGYLSNLSKYYVSQKDAHLVVDGIGPVGRMMCWFQKDLCKYAVAKTYLLTREGLKKAGFGIASTAAKALPIANVVGAAVLSYQAYELYGDYSQKRILATSDLKEKLDRGLQDFFNSFCSADGEFRRQLRIVGEKIIEERTSIWRLAA